MGSYSGSISRLFLMTGLGLISFINCFSVTLATKVQNIFTAAKLVAIAIIIGGGLYMIGIGEKPKLNLRILRQKICLRYYIIYFFFAYKFHRCKAIRNIFRRVSKDQPLLSGRSPLLSTVVYGPTRAGETVVIQYKFLVFYYRRIKPIYHTSF